MFSIDDLTLAGLFGVSIMSIVSDRPSLPGLGHGLGELRGMWGWFVALGVVLVLLGGVVLGSVVVASLAVALVIGGLILAGGLFETIGAFWCRRWSGFFLHLLSGVLSVVIGVLFLTRPVGRWSADAPDGRLSSGRRGVQDHRGGQPSVRVLGLAALRRPDRHGPGGDDPPGLPRLVALGPRDVPRDQHDFPRSQLDRPGLRLEVLSHPAEALIGPKVAA